MQMYSIRCPEERKHYSANGNIEYPTCGHLLAGIEDSHIYLRCPICKQFWKITIKSGDNIEMEKLPKDFALSLKSSVRAIL